MIFIVVLFIYCSVTDKVSFNLYYMSIGLNGITLGYFWREELLDHFSVKKLYAILVLSTFYCLSLYLRENHYDFYFLSVLCSLMSIYIIAKCLNNNNLLFKNFVLLGKYSLIGYLSQILFLQGLFRGVSASIVNGFNPILIIVITWVFVSIISLFVNFLRYKYKVLNSIYNFIF